MQDSATEEVQVVSGLPDIAKYTLGPLTPFEVESIEFFISFFQIIGVPKSVGEIYGLLWVSPAPVPMDVLATRLSLSKGSVSQGLAVLRNLAAIKTVYIAGDRRDHFEATAQLSKIAEAFFRDTLMPRLENAGTRLARLRSLAADLPAPERRAAIDRVASLKFWHDKARGFLPFLVKFLVR